MHLTAGGTDHTCGLTASGEAYCWGFNAFGQLGDGTTTDRDVPVRAAAPLSFDVLDVGPYATCGVTDDGSAYCWGSNGPQNTFVRLEQDGYPLGAPTTELCDNPIVSGGGAYRGTPWPCSTTPIPVPSALRFDDISVALWAACGTDPDGAGHCWGFNFALQLANPDLTGATEPTPMSGGVAFDALSLGATHGCGIVGADAYCWGADFFNSGQLGDGTRSGSGTPVAVAGGLSFAAVAPSDANNIFAFTCGVTVAGDAYCWGSNRNLTLGTEASLATCEFGGFPCAEVPVAVEGGITFGSLAVGNGFACGTSRSRAVHCWGRNNAGQLGDGTTEARPTPVRVLAPDRKAASPAGEAFRIDALKM